MTLAAVATVVQPEQAAAVDLKFDNLVGSTTANLGGANLGPGASRREINYLNVAPGIDARVTATPFGSGYTFTGHLPNYSQAVNEPAGDTGFIYSAATPGQAGGLSYKFDLFNSGGTFTTPFNAQGLALRFLVYDWTLD